MSHDISHKLHSIEHKLNHLITIGDKIMSKISEFVEKQNAFNDQMDVSIAGLNDDIKALKAKIEELQNSPGEVTPEDQALLDALQSRIKSMADKLQALDALTPPASPVV